MRGIRPVSLLVVIVACLVAGFTPATAQSKSGWNRVSSSTTGPVSVVYLVRHAEKLDDTTTKDPALSEEGEVRAMELARMLADAGITHVWSTDLKRTRLTAKPLAERSGITVSTYDPGKLDQLAIRLKTTPGRHLVVGHSNTTPDVVKHLGGEPGPAISDTEYDRFYVVLLSPEGAATVVLRYGSSR